MNCMKCGREIEGDQAFCPKCLEQMAQTPVKPGVVINLPNRSDPALKKPAPRKRERTPAEEIQRLKKMIIRLIVALCLVSVIAAVLAFLSIDVLKQLDVQRFLGQNYSTAEFWN